MAIKATKTVETSKNAQADYAECLCGCGQEVTKRFKPGHDQRLKGILRRAFDAGDVEAGAKLIELGWNTQAQLDDRLSKAAKKAEKATKPEVEIAAE